jgi:hypothetical protein
MRMARGRTVILVAAGVIVAGVAAGTVVEGGSKTLAADSGGGSTPAASSPPAPYAISTLGPIGTAAQDPGGGGGGTGAPGSVAPPGIQGAQGSGSAQGPGGNDGRLYLNGAQLLDPNRSAVTSGSVTVPNPLTAIGGILDLGGNSSSTGCATDAQSADYYAVPLRVETVGFSGTPHAHIRISGSGTVQVRLEQLLPDGSSCATVASGQGSISGGVADVTLSSPGRFQFGRDYTPSLVISAPGSHTITTGSDNPSYIELPGLYGV